MSIEDNMPLEEEVLQNNDNQDDQNNDNLDVVENNIENSVADPIIEEQAKKLGWKPKDIYKGKAEWSDANTYLTRIAEELPKLRAASKSFEMQSKKHIQDIDAVIKYQQLERKQQERQLEKERLQMQQEFNRRHQEAVDEGDYAKARQVVKEEAQYEKEYNDIKQEIQEIAQITSPTISNGGQTIKRQFTPKDIEVANNWIKENQFYLDSPILQRTVDEYVDLHYSRGKDMEAIASELNTYIRKAHPKFFEDEEPKPTQAKQRMLGAGNISRPVTISSNANNEWNKLTPEAQAGYEDMNKMFRIRNMNPISKERYLETCKNDPNYWRK